MHRWTTKLVCLLATLNISLGDEHLVTTPSGPVRGTTTKSHTGKIVEVFYGIPYAEPPIGKLRFGSPVEIKPWTGELNCSIPTPPCYQRIPSFFLKMPEFRPFMPRRPWTEDCLKLHIWVPTPRPENATVMVYFHGGAFILGDPLVQILSGATLAAEENIIVVSMNYRLDVQGFFNLGIPEAPGNQAFMDQQMSLKWIHRNIASFGGNPNQVTIFGISAGGASVGFHLLIPSSRGLFKRGIIMSGTPNAAWATADKKLAIEASLNLLDYSGCKLPNLTEAVECLQAVHSEDILVWNTYPFSWQRMIPIPPVVDEHFIHSPEKLASEGSVDNIDVMIGLTAAEGGQTVAFFVPGFQKNVDGRMTTRQFTSTVRTIFENEDDLTTKILNFLYTNWTHKDDPYLVRDGLINLLSDKFFACPSEEFADVLLNAKMRVYRYVVDHVPKMFRAPEWVKATHGMDSVLHLGIATASNSPDEDKILSKKVMRWWANFARTGDPNDATTGSVTWPPSTSALREYLRIAINPTVETNFRRNECGVLKHFLEAIARHKGKCRV